MEKFIKEFSKWHNHICVLYDMEIVRLVGLGEDEYDLYYIVQHKGYEQVSWCTAVGWIYSLKGMLPEEKYKRLENHWELNHPHVPEFEIVRRV